MKKDEHIRSLSDHLQQAILVINKKGNVIYCNDSASQFWKKDSTKIIDGQIKELFKKDLMIQEKIKEVFRSGKVFKIGEFALQTSPMNQHGAEIVIAPVRGKSEIVQSVVITILENTNLHESQKREHQEKLAISLGDLAADLAHEIQNPLSGIKGILQLLDRDLKNIKFNTTYTSMMLGELERIERLLKKLLFHSQPILLDKTSFDVHELLNTIINFEQNIDTNIIFVRNFDTSLQNILADKDKLHQVFLNLIRNAVEASSKKVVIKVKTRFCGKWELAGTNLNPELDYILITIEDEGSGIKIRHRDKLFKPLFSTKEKGHGLGLSISYGLIQSHKGLLSYSPSKSGGSIFQIFLPHQN
tara:strand:+ start:1063 stop:2139 length:1077 start_codon:yes stop_codon:yes gene_type:complete